MIKLLDAAKAFLTVTTTVLALNSDQAVRSLALIAFLMTSMGSLYFQAENMVKQRV